MSNSPITPSVGRIVLFRALTHGGDYPAIVSFVHDDDNIGLFVFDNNAQTTFHYPKVPFDDAYTPTVASWRWMPYQLATAKDASYHEPPAGTPLTEAELANVGQGQSPPTDDGSQGSAS